MQYQKKKHWKYRIYSDVRIKLHRHFPTVYHDFFEINDNIMTVYAGYCWDGCSGPVPDTKATIAASLPHDVFYQAIREQLLSEIWKREADMEFRDQYVIDQNGYGWIGSIFFKGLDWFGSPSTKCDILTIKMNEVQL